MDAGEDSIGITVDAGARPAPFFSPDRAKTLRRVLAESAIPGTPKPDTLDMPVADGTKQAILAAQEHAGKSTVGLLHVLLGLLTDADNSVSAVLKSVGITVDQVEDAIRNQQP